MHKTSLSVEVKSPAHSGSGKSPVRNVSVSPFAPVVQMEPYDDKFLSSIELQKPWLKNARFPKPHVQLVIASQVAPGLGLRPFDELLFGDGAEAEWKRTT